MIFFDFSPFRYHKYRIANALFRVPVPFDPTGSQLNEGVRAREQQKVDLQSFEGRNAIVTLSQHVGSLALTYLPYAGMVIASLFVNSIDHHIQMAINFALNCSPIVYSVLYGFKSKVSGVTCYLYNYTYS